MGLVSARLQAYLMLTLVQCGDLLAVLLDFDCVRQTALGSLDDADRLDRRRRRPKQDNRADEHADEERRAAEDRGPHPATTCRRSRRLFFLLSRRLEVVIAQKTVARIVEVERLAHADALHVGR